MGVHVDTDSGRSEDIRALCRNVIAAAALAALGVVLAFVSSIAVTPLYETVGTGWTAFGGLLDNYVVQPGFGLVAAVYLWRREDFHLLDRIQKPSGEALAWIGLGPIAYEVAAGGIERVLVAAGLNPYGGHSGTATWRGGCHTTVLIPHSLPLCVVSTG